MKALYAFPTSHYNVLRLIGTEGLGFQFISLSSNVFLWKMAFSKTFVIEFLTQIFLSGQEVLIELNEVTV